MSIVMQGEKKAAKVHAGTQSVLLSPPEATNKPVTSCTRETTKLYVVG